MKWQRLAEPYEPGDPPATVSHLHTGERGGVPLGGIASVAKVIRAPSFRRSGPAVSEMLHPVISRTPMARAIRNIQIRSI